MKKSYRKIAKIALILVYLVIIAGAVVRMTGSGMGCPDWPKCFGYYIPPTQIEDIQFKPQHQYEKGVIIIKDKALLVATNDFTSSNQINLANWKPYTKHDYSKFNATHTWVEYVNRLIGALAGIPILIFTIMSFWFWKKNKSITIISILTLFGMAFQGWLGKTVVDSNLAPFKITIHMVMAMVIVALILYLIFITKRKVIDYKKSDTLFKNVLVLALALTLIQIILGTQVRQHVDEQVKSFGYIKYLWLDKPTIQFYIHRTFSIIILGINIWLLYRNKTYNLGYYKMYLVVTCIILEGFTGILMYYFDFPFLTQPIHLVIATVLFGFQFYIILESRCETTLKISK